MANKQPILVDAATPDNPPAADTAAKAPAPEATGPAQDNAADIPEKYRGKSDKELIEMLEAAQSTIGRQSNEVGTWRKLVDELVDAKRAKDLAGSHATPEAPPTPPRDITPDFLLENPRKAVLDAVLPVLEERLRPLEQTLSATSANTEQQKFERDFPDYQQVTADPAFQEWVSKSQYRLKDAQAAFNGSFESARRLLTDWQDRNPPPAQTEPPPTRSTGTAAARRAATDSPGNGAASPPAKTWTTSELLDVMLKEPDRYRSPSFQKELRSAIREKRVLD